MRQTICEGLNVNNGTEFVDNLSPGYDGDRGDETDEPDDRGGLKMGDYLPARLHRKEGSTPSPISEEEIRPTQDED